MATEDDLIQFDQLDSFEDTAAAPPYLLPPSDPKGVVLGGGGGYDEGSVLGGLAHTGVETVKDMGRIVAGGVERAGIGTLQTLTHMIPGVPDFMDEAKPTISTPVSTMGAMLQTVVQLGVGMIGGQRALQGAVKGFKTLPPLVQETASVGLGSALVGNAHEARLADIVQKFPMVENPMTAYLASDPTDSVAEGKFKIALENMLLTPAASLVFHAVKGLKNKVLTKDDEQTIITDIKTIQDTPGGPPERFPEKIIVDDVAARANEKLTTPLKSSADEPTPTASPAVGPTTSKILPPDGTPTTTPPPPPGATSEAPKVVVAVKEVSPFEIDEAKTQEFLAHVEAQIKGGHTDDLSTPLMGRGVFNYGKWDSAEHVKRVTIQLADMVNPLVDKHIGAIRTHDEVRKLADMAGTQPDVFLGDLRIAYESTQNLDSIIVSTKIMAQSITREIISLATNIHTGLGGGSAKVEILRLKSILQDVLGMGKSIQKSAARGTSAGRIRTSDSYTPEHMMKLLDESGEDVMALAKRIVLAEGDEEKVAKLIRHTQPTEAEITEHIRGLSTMGKIVSTHNEYWMNAILSGVKTWVVNPVSAVWNTLAQPFNIIVGGATNRDTESIRHGVALYRGLYTTIFDSLEMASRSWRNQTSILDPGNDSIETSLRAISSRYWDVDHDSKWGQGLDAAGTVINTPRRVLTTQDEFFKQINYRANVFAEASGDAYRLVQSGQLDPKKMLPASDDGGTAAINEVEHYIQQRVKSAFEYETILRQDGTSSRTQTYGLEPRSLRYAQEATFTQPVHIPTHEGWKSIGELVSISASHPVLRGTILPFVKVPINITRQFVDYTPITAPLTKRYQEALAEGGVTAAAAKGKLAVGSMLWTAGALLTSQGRVTGGGPGDRVLWDAKVRTGWQAYSFVFGGEDAIERDEHGNIITDNRTYISFRRFDPFGMFFGLAADFHDIYHNLDAKNQDGMAIAMTTAMATNISSKLYLKGVVDAASMLGSGYAKEEVVRRAMHMRIASYIPNIVGAFNPDDELKHVRTVMDALRAKTPGFSSTVEAKRDYLGKKRVAADGYPWNAINPATVSSAKSGRVEHEMARLATSPVAAKFTVPQEKDGNINLTQYHNAGGQSAYDRWTELVGTIEIGGRTFEQKLNDVMQSDRYVNGTDGTSSYHLGNRVAMILAEQERYRLAAKNTMLKEFQDEFDAGKLPFDLRAATQEDTRNKRRVRRGKDPQPIDNLLNLSQ